MRVNKFKLPPKKREPERGKINERTEENEAAWRQPTIAFPCRTKCWSFMTTIMSTNSATGAEKPHVENGTIISQRNSEYKMFINYLDSFRHILRQCCWAQADGAQRAPKNSRGRIRCAFVRKCLAKNGGMLSEKGEPRGAALEALQEC